MMSRERLVPAYDDELAWLIATDKKAKVITVDFI